MSRKHLGVKRAIRQFVKAVDEMFEYVQVFDAMPPRGDGAKEMAIKEWKTAINNVIIQINNIRNTQIDILKESGE